MAYALSFRAFNLYGTGYLKLLNTTFLNNENAVFVYGGFALRFSGVTINSTYGYAMSASGPPNVLPGVKGIKVFLDKCIFANNRWGLRMATVACLRYASLCSASTQILVVKNSLFLGGKRDARQW